MITLDFDAFSPSILKERKYYFSYQTCWRWRRHSHHRLPILQDIKAGLYDSYHFNFASSLPRPMMEDLAKAALECDSVSQISKVFDQYLNFVSLEDRLFHLNQQNSYVDFHDPTLSDSKGEENVERTAEALFSSIVTLGVIPIIRAPRGDAAELVARRLESKIREHLSGMGNLLVENAAWNRPGTMHLSNRNILSAYAFHPRSFGHLGPKY